MKENSKTIGERSEGMILASFLRKGYVVLMPFGDNQRYDLVIDVGDGKFSRIQCKTGRISRDGNSIITDTCSSQTHRGKGKQNYRGQIESFAIYVPKLDKIYLVPVDIASKTVCTLRLNPSRNANQYESRMASDYEF
jgi:hypothetical protein